MLKWSVTSSKPGDMETPKRPLKSVKRRRSSLSHIKESLVTSTPMKKMALMDPFAILEATRDENIQQLLVSQQAATPFASTLPRYAEEYSPSPKISSGQAIAMRGLLPDIYLGNPRYLAKHVKKPSEIPPPAKDEPTMNSTKMGDNTLDKLIDAILESGKKSLKKGARRSMNLRRKTLMKNSSTAGVLSPSYTAGDDPASDLSFSEEIVKKRKSSSPLVVSNVTARKKSRLSSPRVCKQSRLSNSNYFEVGLAMPSIYV